MREASGEPEKKLVVVRSEGPSSVLNAELRADIANALSRYCRRSATASRSFSRSKGSYACDLRKGTAGMQHGHVSTIFFDSTNAIYAQQESQQLQTVPIARNEEGREGIQERVE